MAGLQLIQQADFTKGMFRNPSPELIPANGVADVVNGLLEEDGSIYKRGGTSTKSIATPGFSPLTFVWDGFTAGGPRTLAAGRNDLGRPFWALNPADDTTPVNLGGPGTMSERAASGDGLVFVPVGAASGGSVVAWGGSIKTANYAIGTITVALLSRSVVGVGTAFLANIDPGMLLFAGVNYVGTVASVETDTALTLHDFAQTAVSAGGYLATPMQVWTPVTVPAGQQVFVGTAGDPARLLVGYRNQVKFSNSGNPFKFDATDYHQVPEGQIIGLVGLQDQAFVFTTAGVWVISNLNFNLIDAFGNPQQRLTQLTKDVILLDARGIAGYRNQLVVPGTDDIWLMGPAQYPVAISDPIRTLYRQYVKAGWVCGGAAVYRNHYILPILVGFTVTDTLIHRLDQGGWTRFASTPKANHYATRSTGPTRAPALLAAVTSATNQGIIGDYSGCWVPGQSNSQDFDGSTFTFQVTTRDYPTGQAANHNLVKKIRVRYEMVAASAGPPALKALFGVGGSSSTSQWGAATWGSFLWADTANAGFIPLQGSANGGDAPADAGTNPFPWLVNQQAPAFFRLRLICSDPAAKLVIREIDSFVRSRSRQ